MYLSGPTTTVVGPKALGGRFRCALPSFVVWRVIAYSLSKLLLYYTLSKYTLRLSTQHSKERCVRSFCVVVGFLLGAFHCAVFLAGDRMGTARCVAPTR